MTFYCHFLPFIGGVSSIFFIFIQFFLKKLARLGLTLPAFFNAIMLIVNCER